MNDVYFIQNQESSVYDDIEQKNIDKLIDRFLEDSLIAPFQLRTIYDEIEHTGQNIIEAIEKSNIISPDIIFAYLRNIDTPYVNFKNVDIVPETVRKIPKYYALEHKLIAFSEDENNVKIAFIDPGKFEDLSELTSYFDGKEVIQYMAKESEIIQYIDKIYEYKFIVTEIISEMEIMEKVDIDDIGNDYESPVMRLVDAILQDAVHKDASDIHIQPDEKFIRVRYRMDGIMHNQFTFQARFYPSIMVRIKIISNMNIAESVKPQDGSIKKFIIGRNIDFRVSLMPTIYGEGVVMRVLDKKENVSSLDALNICKGNFDKIVKILNTPEGVLIMTGPTGSGKTTTLYAMMSFLSSPDVNMMTLEDPVEYTMPMARQMNVNVDAGITFASGLRAILRQDPDIILVGEMRDDETAITAMRAAMTGHKVFSTLHTNSAVSAISRLLDLGVSRNVLASSVNGIVAQRLLRSLCTHCKIKTKITDEDLQLLKISKSPVEYIYKASENGCDECRKTGYRGRVAIMEVLYFDKYTRALIEDGASEHKITESLRERKLLESLKIDGLRKVFTGISSIAELRKAIDLS